MKSVLIYGSMFAGKSNKLIDLYNEANYNNPLIFKPKIDNRTQEVFSRTGKAISAIPIDSWDEIYQYINSSTDSIFVDESQFLSEEKEDSFLELLSSLKKHNIDLFVSTLDRDFLGNKFLFFKKYSEHFDKHIFLYSVCIFCKSPALFSNKYKNNTLVTDYDNLIDIDTKVKDTCYVAVCKKHNLKINNY